MKILISGFEAFGGSTINPTEKLVKVISSETFAGVELKTVLLPVNYDECAEAIIKEIEVYQPDAVISCGLYHGRTSVTPERIAVNVKDTAADAPYADNKGVKPTDEPINPDGPDALFTQLPVRKMVNRLNEEGVPAYISNTAGTFICNNTMYGVLDYIRKNNISTIAGFVHFPASTEMAVENPLLPALPHETMLRALRIIIQTTIDDLQN
ncbi:pyroglutamyl-peptidase I [Paenibacillus filicis]|uniref:Pyroglutamyl-peptidase I n=1 Tax=Paenibacillus gyeongsangnamensis TaxID=3388067 RepID=A0ABT4QD99_9BACL|nr:pyroglutamyl-peptidase I [Paenibacillus filicis]MCZ8514746.1 pyroglutamyl-peptidase I [Paenibacillus filicis]